MLSVASALLASVPFVADAQITKLAEAGVWQAAGGLEDGHQNCAIASVTGAPGSIMMFVEDDAPGLVRLAFQKDGWAIPKEVRIPILIRFNDGFNVSVVGTGNGSAINVNFPSSVLKAWIHSFTSGRSMTVEFSGGNEPAWSLDLTGTTPVISAMAKCITDAAMTGLPPPFASGETPSAQPTQPFAAKSGSATQPFVPTSPGYVPAPSVNMPAPASSAFTDRAEQPLAGVNRPAQEAALVRAVTQFAVAYDAASNDFAKGAQRQARARAICSILSGRSVQNWTGHIQSLSSSSSGDGVLSVTIAENVTLKTYNNSFSDMSDNTLIKESAPFYANLSQAKEGASVTFSGNFSNSTEDCIKEGSLTQAGSMREPEFIFRFSDVKLQ